MAEVALAFVLLVGAGLLLRSFLHLAAVEPGYDPDRVLIATLTLDPAKYHTPARSAAFLDELLERLGQHANVEAAGVVSFPPLAPGFSLTSLNVVGQPPARTMAVPQMTSPAYLEAMGLQLAEGRWLTEQDHLVGAPVAVINETFARRYLADLQVIGRCLEVGSATLQIVGVVKDVRLLGAASDPKPELFTSYRQAEALSGAGPERLTLAIRVGDDPMALTPFLRALVLELDPGLALEDVATMQAKLAASVAQPRFYALLLGVFAGMALVLASAGVYGVLSYSVARQTRAIGVRRALGARGKDILAFFLRNGLLLVSSGLMIGMAAAFATSRVLAHLLFEVTMVDPLSYAVAALLLVAVAVPACYLPARRATRVDVIEALRFDR